MLTFLSPCVLPLIPGYLSMISGVSLNEIKSENYTSLNREIFYHTLFFVSGFSLIFTILGATASFVGQFLLENKTIIQKIMGLIIIVLGLHIAGFINITFLNYENRNIKKFQNKSYYSSFIIGMSFAFGWSPCVGPILSGILMMAAKTNPLKGSILLFVYSFGLGLLFLFAGLASGYFFRFVSKYKNKFRYVEIFSGLILIFIGILLFLNKLFMD